MRRLKQNWIDEYVKYVAPASESPLNYHEWCAATLIAATLKRHVFIERGLYRLYPNMFVVLVGRPGLGKGGAINPAMSILREANTANVLSDRITIEYVLEKMAKGFTHVAATSNGAVQFGKDSSLLTVSPELSIFVTASQHTLPILADLWDAREGEFVYGTRHKGEYKIKDACMSILGGSAPEWLVSSIPRNAIGGGFTRRVNFVFAKDKASLVPWPTMNHTAMRDSLVDDLRQISTLKGEVKFTPEAKFEFEKFYKDCDPEEFDDEATVNYKTSKWVQAAKLAIARSVAEADDLLITKSHVAYATSRIDEVCKDIAVVFRAVGESDFVSSADKVLRFIEVKGFASKGDILKANWKHFTSAELDVILITFVTAGVLIERQQGNKQIFEVVAKAVKSKP